jgi:hypothetical protein
MNGVSVASHVVRVAKYGCERSCANQLVMARLVPNLLTLGTAQSLPKMQTVFLRSGLDGQLVRNHVAREFSSVNE